MEQEKQDAQLALSVAAESVAELSSEDRAELVKSSSELRDVATALAVEEPYEFAWREEKLAEPSKPKRAAEPTGLSGGYS